MGNYIGGWYGIEELRRKTDPAFSPGFYNNYPEVAVGPGSGRPVPRKSSTLCIGPQATTPKARSLRGRLPTANEGALYKYSQQLVSKSVEASLTFTRPCSAFPLPPAPRSLPLYPYSCGTTRMSRFQKIPAGPIIRAPINARWRWPRASPTSRWPRLSWLTGLIRIWYSSGAGIPTPVRLERATTLGLPYLGKIHTLLRLCVLIHVLHTLILRKNALYLRVS